MLNYCVYNSKIGKITIAEKNGGIVCLFIQGQTYFISNVKESMQLNETPCLTIVKKWLDRYFLGENLSVNDINLTPQGSSFQKIVWKTLQHIPYGVLTTYGEIAKKIENATGKRVSARAVGGAVGRNPISIIIPCHRVIGANNKLTGYAGGIPLKIELLKLEGIIVDNLK